MGNEIRKRISEAKKGKKFIYRHKINFNPAKIKLMERCPELAMLLRHTPDSIVFKRFAENGRLIIEMASESKGRKYGGLKDVIGRDDFELFSIIEEAQKCYDSEILVMRTGVPLINEEEKITRADGNVSYISTSKIPWTDNATGEIIGVIVISRDITDSKKRDGHIVDMLASATHILNSRVHTIMVLLELILKSKHGGLNDKDREKVTAAYDTAAEMKGVTTTYLAKSNFLRSSGIGEKELLDLRRDIIDPLLVSFCNKIKSKNISIDDRLGGIPEGRILVSANKLWLISVYHNLFDNAIRHLDHGGTLAYGFEDRGDFYWLNVYNNGKPIPLGDEESIFEMGHSGEGSSGLGLPMSRDFVRRQGGDLRCVPTNERHANFIIMLPKEEEVLKG